MATAFCIYSETDNSLNFYKRESVPVVGDTFENKVVTKIYTGFETTKYTDSSHPDWQKDKTIKSVVTVNFIDVIKPVSLDGWFRDGHIIESFNLANLDTSSCTNMGYVFRDCYAIKHLDVSNFNTSKVTNMKSMFYNLNNLEELDVSNFDTGLVKYMNFMFYACLQCNIIGLDKFNTKSATNMQSMFYKCCSIKNLNLSSWNTSNCTNMSYMFTGAVGNLDLSGWNTSKVTTMASMFGASFFTYLDLSSFDVSALTTCNSMFFNNEVVRTILVSYNWNERFSESADTNWMFENCFSLMGDVAYTDIVDHSKPIEEIWQLMTGDYATTKGGYLTMKYAESEDDGEGDSELNDNTYMVLGRTLEDIANSMREITGVPSKIALNNFSKILRKQINSVEAAKVMFKDKRFINDDVACIGYANYINTNFKSIHKDITRFVIFPTVIKGSIISFSDLISLEDGKGKLVCSGDVVQIDEGSFIINGDCTIELIENDEVGDNNGGVNIPELCDVSWEIVVDYTSGNNFPPALDITYSTIDESGNLVSTFINGESGTLQCLPMPIYGNYSSTAFNGMSFDYIEIRDVNGEESYDVAYIEGQLGEVFFGHIYDSCHLIFHVSIW